MKMSVITEKLTRTGAPFRGDQVGSFLRPKALKEARKAYAEGNISLEELRKVEDNEIDKLVNKQVESGLKAITDGEFRRSWWHLDFLEGLTGIEGYVPEHGYFFEGVETEKYDVRNTGKIAFNPNHSFFEHFIFLKESVGDRALPKFTIPSPNQLLHQGIRDETIYPTVEAFCEDIQQAYRETIQEFYRLGCRYLQIDDCFWGVLCYDKVVEDISEQELTYLKELSAKNVQAILKDKPADLVITTHICRGNYASTFAGSGAYEPVAKELFGQTDYDGYFLEYDTERSGGFEPLRFYKGQGQIVLGLITSKTGDLEAKEDIKARIQEASKYVPLEQLCLSTQCGFASTEEGNHLTEEEQWNKLKLVLEVSQEVWGN